MGVPPIIFEILDWKQRTVRLTRRTYEKHCTYRPETALYLEEAKAIIRDPDTVLANDKGATLLYRFGLGKPPFTNLYLQVVIYYDVKSATPESGTVATFFFTDKMEVDAVLLEHRAQVILGKRISLISKGQDHGDG